MMELDISCNCYHCIDLHTLYNRLFAPRGFCFLLNLLIIFNNKILSWRHFVTKVEKGISLIESSDNRLGIVLK